MISEVRKSLIKYLAVLKHLYNAKILLKYQCVNKDSDSAFKFVEQKVK